MQNFVNLAEKCRLVAVRHLIRSKALFPTTPSLLLDIACGQARYTPFLLEAFPNSQIVGVDISPRGLELARENYPDNYYAAGMSEAMPLKDNSVDMIFSIETLEHVDDVRATIKEWSRILKPGGKILFTTPCANRFSLEWFIMFFSGGLQPSADGYGRFRRDESGHLRRLTTKHVEEIFQEFGLKVTLERFRTHFFTTIAYDYLRKRPLKLLSYPVASLDWRLLRWFPNGASMIIIGEKL